MDISVLVYVLLIIAFAKMFGELFSRFNQPAIVGELLAGIILGPFVLGEIFESLNSMYTDEFIQGLADLGVLLLMLYVGLEFSPKRLLASSWLGAAIAFSAMLLPIALGFLVGAAFGYEGVTLIFLALALGVTALPVAIRILKDMEVLHCETSGRIISAALITDISIIFAMGFILGGNAMDQPMDRLLLLIGGYAVFFAMAVIVSKFVVGELYRLLRWMQTGEAAFAVAIGIAILFAVVADAVGLPNFIGAFIAGLILRETGKGLRVWARVEDILSGITIGFLVPIFFVSIGFAVDFAAFFEGGLVVVALFVIILAVVIGGKLIGTLIPAKLGHLSTDESLAIGAMLMGNGAMEAVFARLAFEQGIIGTELFSILILMAFVTTSLAPIMFKRYFNCAVRAGKIERSDKEFDKQLELDYEFDAGI